MLRFGIWRYIIEVSEEVFQHVESAAQVGDAFKLGTGTVHGRQHSAGRVHTEKLIDIIRTGAVGDYPEVSAVERDAARVGAGGHGGQRRYRREVGLRAWRGREGRARNRKTIPHAWQVGHTARTGHDRHDGGGEADGVAGVEYQVRDRVGRQGR